MSTVQTVLGPVRAEALGPTLTHEHLLMDLFRGFQPHREFLLNDRDLVVAELAELSAAGGQTVVEVTTPDLGRNPAGLVDIARRTGLNIVMATGRYREPFYEDALVRTRTDALAEEFVRDIDEGVDGVRAGIIGEIGTHEAHISPAEERVHRAAARAHLWTGVPITTHSNASPVGLTQLDLFEEEGVDLRRVVVGHCDTFPVPDYHLEILRRGAWVQFDTVRGTFEYETSRQARQLAHYVRCGHLDQLLVSQDMASNRLYRAYGGEGFGFVMGPFRSRLRDAGLSEDEVHRILVDNPRRMLIGDRT